jgi:thiol:disulfide interchange protein
LFKFIKYGLAALILAVLLIGLGPDPASAKGIAWQRFSEGMARSKSENKKVFLHFYATWCGACRTMENKTFRDPAVIAYLNENFVPIKVDTDRQPVTSRMFRIRVLPDNWFIDEDGKPMGHQPGYIAPKRLKDMLKQILEDETRP